MHWTRLSEQLPRPSQCPHSGSSGEWSVGNWIYTLHVLMWMKTKYLTTSLLCLGRHKAGGTEERIENDHSIHKLKVKENNEYNRRPTEWNLNNQTPNRDGRKSYMEQERQTSGKKFRKGIEREVYTPDWTQLTCLEWQSLLAMTPRILEMGTSV